MKLTLEKISKKDGQPTEQELGKRTLIDLMIRLTEARVKTYECKLDKVPLDDDRRQNVLQECIACWNDYNSFYKSTYQKNPDSFLIDSVESISMVFFRGLTQYLDESERSTVNASVKPFERV